MDLWFMICIILRKANGQYDFFYYQCLEYKSQYIMTICHYYEHSISIFYDIGVKISIFTVYESYNLTLYNIENVNACMFQAKQ